MKLIIIPIVPILLVTCYSSMAQEAWSLKKDKDGIKVFSRSSDSSKFDEVRAEFDMQASLSDMVAVMMDVDHHVDWVYGTKSSSLLKKVNDSDLYFYTEMEIPWPLSNRDLAVHLSFSQQPQSKVVTIVAVSVPHYIPEKKSIVRVPFSSAVWTITPIGHDSIHVAYHVQVDPGGAIPAWLFNMFVSKSPYESFEGLRSRAREERYRLANVSFISNR
ncbi:MAG TPA: START domain-containing protein [Puia sp.]|nr:START domain-containing protein [Puia sp.]